ncbi:MAG: ORF6N domain-containing protein [Candidatus Omnitrophica bacterium]|nr:ORF6N domain-containing protein [Candidatus Omnitrophota bacterium]MBU1869565.1 ORF6N domain-containing protein [Candidatus Omnitrophota bacterium]
MPKSIAVELIATRILELRGRKVMLDRNLAKLYGVKVKRLNEQVKRNKKRFPDDFMFQVSREEMGSLRSQTVTLNSRSQIATLKQGQNIKYLPYVFTEHGVAMLSSVLNSERAIQVNILIMRAFTKLREILLTHKELSLKIAGLEKKYAEHDQTIRTIFQAIKQLLEPPPTKERKITGFSNHDNR